jgi:hypothetical protein
VRPRNGLDIEKISDPNSDSSVVQPVASRYNDCATPARKSPCSPLKIIRCFGGLFCLHLQDRKIRNQVNCLRRGQDRKDTAIDLILVPCLAYFSTLILVKMCAFETSVFNWFDAVI